MQASAAPRAEGETQATPKHREVTHVLAVALREVDDARADGGEAHERAGAGVPQLRVEALLLCRHAHKHSAISLVRTPPRQELESKRIDSGGRAPGSSTQARQPRASETRTFLRRRGGRRRLPDAGRGRRAHVPRPAGGAKT
jgi:hypothetical protein